MERQKIETALIQKKVHDSTKNGMPLVYKKNKEGLFVCPHCDYKKSNQSSMHYHMKKHEEERSHICKTCKKGFLQKQTLELHIRSKHPELKTTEEKKSSCPFDKCAFTAMTKGNCIIHCLRTHFQEEMKASMNVHEDTKIIECTTCNKEFQSSCSFYYHAKRCFPFDTKNEKYQKLQSLI